MYWGRIFDDKIIPADRPSEDEHKRLKEKHGNAVLRIEVKLPRSAPHHRLFFAAISEAFNQWPESHSFQPDNSEHLRAWLLVKAGYREKPLATRIEGDVPSASLMADFVERVVAVTMGTGKYGFAVVHGEHLIVLTPRSIAWEELEQNDFNVVSQKVSDVLKAEVNMSLDDFKREAGEAA